LSKATKEEIFVVDDYALIVVGCGNIECQTRVIIDVYHEPSLSVNLLSVLQLIQTGKKVELCHDRFVVKDINNGVVVKIEGILDPKDTLHKFCDFIVRIDD
jgi:hypothetical protein